jgi:type II secretory pathway component PulF
MPDFHYRGLSISGSVSGFIEASSKKSAESLLKAKGIKVVNLKVERPYDVKTFWLFLSLIKSLLDQKISLVDALEISLNQSNAKIKKIANRTLSQLSEGQTLDVIFENIFKGLDRKTLSLLKIGSEQSGLAHAAGILLDEQKLKKDINREFNRAIAYPAFVLLFSVAALIVVFDTVLPEFSQFIDIQNQTLLQKMILNGAGRGYTTFLSVLWVSLFVGFSLLALRKLNFSRKFFYYFMTTVPGLKLISRKTSAYEYLNAINLSMSLNVDLGLSVQMAEKTITNPIHREKIANIKTLLLNGVTFSTAIRETELFEPMQIAKIEVGEKSKTLPEILNSIVKDLIEKRRQRFALFSQLIGPFAIILLGIIIFLVAYVVVTPMIALQNTIG